MATQSAMPTPNSRPSCQSSRVSDMPVRQTAPRTAPQVMIERMERRSSSGPTTRPDVVITSMSSDWPRLTCMRDASKARATGSRKTEKDPKDTPMAATWVTKPTPTMRQPWKVSALPATRALYHQPARPPEKRSSCALAGDQFVVAAARPGAIR